MRMSKAMDDSFKRGFRAGKKAGIAIGAADEREKIEAWLEGSLKVAHIWNQGGSRDRIMAELATRIRNGDQNIAP
jgi:hypothetical protein